MLSFKHTLGMEKKGAEVPLSFLQVRFLMELSIKKRLQMWGVITSYIKIIPLT